jgi:uncharacterized protein (DUF362 family)
MKPRVALTHSGSRAQNIDQALRLIKDDINLKGKKNVLVKVNFTSRDNGLGATNVEAVRALLKFLREFYKGKITIGESTNVPAAVRYERFGYNGLEKEFDVELADLNLGQWEIIDLYDAELKPMKVHFAKKVIESDYRIAIGPPKTHDVVVVTLSLKNLAMGGLRDAGGDKRKLHQGYAVHNLDLYVLAKAFPPQLSIIDGFIGMEGEGPVVGDPVNWGVAIASTEPVAADCLAAQLMGFHISDIGYLWYLQQKKLGVCDIKDMEILGATFKECQRPFRPHSFYKEQKEWRKAEIDKIVGI